jgi:hypothetical protein
MAVVNKKHRYHSQAERGRQEKCKTVCTMNSGNWVTCIKMVNSSIATLYFEGVFASEAI